MSDRFAPAPAAATIQTFIDELGLEAVIQQAVSYDPAKFARLHAVPAVWNWSLKNSAGRAHWNTNLGRTTYKISLHPGLQSTDRSDLEATFLHEVAHIMAYMAYGPSGGGHGYEWWEAMIRLGLHPRDNRYHSIPQCMKRHEATAEELGL